MTYPKIVFAIYDTTSYRCLSPIARNLRSDASVEFLLFDDLLQMARKPLPKGELSPHRNAVDYVRNPVSKKINQISRQQPIPEIIVQRLLEDNVSARLAYDISGYLDDANPDVFVSAHDILPFIKHLIEESHRRDFKSVVVQHGINRPFLENPSDMPGIPNLLSPSVEPQSSVFERVKRRLGFRHGPFVFCNPYVDELYTFGDFFTDLLSELRSHYPNFGKTDVITTGSSEFNPSDVEHFERSVRSALFLSQWQYENGDWNDDQQRTIVGMLELVEDQYDTTVAVRPHPKDSIEKMRSFFTEFPISTDSDLETVIGEHDLILTVDSTAIFQGVLQGKVCGVVQPPWDPSSFLPFTHEHIVQITSDQSYPPDEVSQSTATQRDYLHQCCYVPSLDSTNRYSSPVEYISDRILLIAQD